MMEQDRDDVVETLEEGGSFDKFMDDILLKEERVSRKQEPIDETPARLHAKRRSEHPTRKMRVKG
jgi:hypothetical protein